MTPEEIEAHQQARRGKYGWVVEGAEVLSDTPPTTHPWYRYADNYYLEIKK